VTRPGGNARRPASGQSSAQLNGRSAGAGVADRLAHVGAVGQREQLGVGLDQVGEPVQQRAALSEAHPRPGALDEGAGVWATLNGLVLLQALQALSVLTAGMLTGAGQRRGFVYGAVMGVWNGVFFVVAQHMLGRAPTTVSLFGEPILQAAFGAVGGMIGSLIWRPLPSLKPYE